MRLLLDRDARLLIGSALVMSLTAFLAGTGCPRPAPAPVPAPVPTPGPSPLPGPGAEVQALLDSTNAARAADGLPLVRLSIQLTRAAQYHANYMAVTGTLAHEGVGDGTPWSRLTTFGYGFEAAAENVAEGYATAALCEAGWMADPPHRANMLGPYVDAGFGVATSTSGVTFWCADYGKPATARVVAPAAAAGKRVRVGSGWLVEPARTGPAGGPPP